MSGSPRSLRARNADTAKGNLIQDKLEGARREYETLRQDAEADLLPEDIYHLAVEHLYWRLTMELEDR